MILGFVDPKEMEKGFGGTEVEEGGSAEGMIIGSYVDC